MEGGSRRAAAAAASAVLPVPDELIVEILARLPAKSLCLCKCVSRAWRALVSDPANRRRFAQTLSGLFFSGPYGGRPAWEWHFVGLSMSSVVPPPTGVDAALSFLPPSWEMELLDSCSGLLLLRCEDSSSRELPSPPPLYVVCNPATGEWVTLPQPSRVPGLDRCPTSVGPAIDTGTAALGFDPSVSLHFHVFQLVQMKDGHHFLVRAVEIYSSRTGRWVLRANELQSEMADGRDYDIRLTGSVTYFKGFLHFCVMSNAVVSVDTEGKTWKVSQLLHRQHADCVPASFVCHSQGRLVYVDNNDWRSDVLSIYVLEDHDSEEWTWIFKQSINKLDLFGPRLFARGWDYYTAAFHPDSDLILFFDPSRKRLVSYDMKHRDVHVICTLEVCCSPIIFTELLFLPYVPLYSRALPSASLN